MFCLFFFFGERAVVGLFCWLWFVCFSVDGFLVMVVIGFFFVIVVVIVVVVVVWLAFWYIGFVYYVDLPFVHACFFGCS